MKINRPVEFDGTDQEAKANRATHRFDPYASRCTDCDCRPWGSVADYPCGATVPRETVEVGG